MSNIQRTLQSALVHALAAHYGEQMHHAMRRDGDLTHDRLERFERATQRLAAQLAEKSEFDSAAAVQSVLDGSAEFDDVFVLYQQGPEELRGVLKDQAIVPLSTGISTSQGTMVVGRQSDFTNQLGQLSMDALTAPAALLTTPRLYRGLPRLAETHLYVNGNEVLERGDYSVAGGLLLVRVGPFGYQIYDEIGRLAAEEDLLGQYASAVTAIRHAHDYGLTFEQYIADFLRRVQTTQQAAAEHVKYGRQDFFMSEEDEMGGPQQALIAAVSLTLLGIDEQSSIARGAFYERSPLRGALASRFAAAQIASLKVMMEPVRRLTAYLSDDPMRVPSKEELRAKFELVEQVISPSGLMVFFDLFEYLKQTYLYTRVAKDAAIDLRIESTTERFQSVEPIPTRALLDHVMQRAIEGNRNNVRLGLEIFLDETRQLIRVAYDRPQNSLLRQMLEEVRERRQFTGTLDYEERDGLVTAVKLQSQLPGSGGLRLPGMGQRFGSMPPRLVAAPAASFSQSAGVAGGMASYFATFSLISSPISR